MADQGGRDRLSGKTRIVTVLTLLVGADGQVIHGRIFDAGGRPPLAFSGLAALGGAIQRWIDGGDVALNGPSAGPVDPEAMSLASLAERLDEGPAMARDPESDRFL